MPQTQLPPALDVSGTPIGKAKGRRARETEAHTVNPLARGGDQPPPPAKVGQPLPIDQIFAEVDTDNSGTIEFGEFAEYWGARQLATKGSTDEEVLGTMWDLFERYDADGQAGLSLFEFQSLLSGAVVSHDLRSLLLLAIWLISSATLARRNGDGRLEGGGRPEDRAGILRGPDHAR
jgi:hypothetical protein